MVTLVFGEVHLWLVFCDEVDERLHRIYRALLSAEEKEQERRFHFSKDRLRYAITRVLVRSVLSRYSPVDLQSWSFSTNPYGRPEIANLAADELRLSFNVSHTQGLVVLAVTSHRAVGVDVENVRTREVSPDLADRFFAPVEAQALATVAPDQRQDRFFEYWTFKESYIKARGMGLSLPLDKFSFHYPNHRSVYISIHRDLADDPRRWQFWQFRPTRDHLVALCAERIGTTPAEVVARKIVPMASETTFVPEFLRTSGLQANGEDRRSAERV
jgi:4'-phosphopantetheinyl transferase